MKLIFVCLTIAFIGCKTEEKKETPAMPGAYTMASVTMNDGTKDTSSSTMQQMKIFTDSHLMYANLNTADSTSSFGVGTYSASDSGTVAESIIYSAWDSTENTSPNTFTLYIEKTPKGYTQVIKNMGTGETKFTLTEKYEAIGSGATSPLDGIWQQVSAYNVVGNDTTRQTAVQYKAYSGGHFMFAHTFRDSANKISTGMGYGSFVTEGANKVKETIQASTYAQAKGRTFDLDITTTGADEYQQIITDTSGRKSVEIYKRLKK